MEFGTNYWDYTGDVNLEYGGTFAKLDPYSLKYGYADVVEVTDLASACGANGMVLIEKGTVNFDRDRIRTAMESCGWLPIRRKEWNATPRAKRKTLVLGAIRSYYGMDVDAVETLTTDNSYPREHDGWRANKLVTESDLSGYVAAKYLD